MRQSRLSGWRKIVNDSRALLLVAASAGLAGCSALPDYANPVEWFRDVSGAAKNDAQDQGQRNSQNLDAGSHEPYPNLATVPPPPDQAMSTIDRDKLQQGLVADRAHARYSDEQLREGKDVPPLPGAGREVALAEPATAAPAPGPGSARTTQGSHQVAPPKGSAPAPQESALASPSIGSLPQGQLPRAAPPAPGSSPQPHEQLAVVTPPRPSSPSSAPSPRPAPSPPPAYVPVEPAVQPSIMRAPGGKGASVELEATEIAFAGDAKTLSAADNQRLAETAKLQKEGGASLRVIGYAQRGTGAKAAERELQSFGEALDRANAVAAELTRLGVPAGRITVQAAPALAAGGLPAGQVVVLLDY